MSFPSIVNVPDLSGGCYIDTGFEGIKGCTVTFGYCYNGNNNHASGSGPFDGCEHNSKECHINNGNGTCFYDRNRGECMLTL